MQFQMAMPPTNRYKQFLKLRDGSSAQPCRKVKMQGDAILIASSFVFHLGFCDQNHIPLAHAQLAVAESSLFRAGTPGQVTCGWPAACGFVGRYRGEVVPRDTSMSFGTTGEVRWALFRLIRSLMPLRTAKGA